MSKEISQTSLFCLSFSLVSLLLGLVLFSSLEAGRASAANPEFVIVRQEVTAELSMTVASTTMVLLPSIPGLSGGTGNASTTVNIMTGNTDGYFVTIQALGTVAAMNGDTAGGYFTDYATTTAETWTNTLAGGPSQFGFGITNISLSSPNSADGYSSCTVVDDCWSKVPTTTAKEIVRVDTNTPAEGDDFALKFRARIPANANPAVPEDWYTASTTITAVQL